MPHTATQRQLAETRGPVERSSFELGQARNVLLVQFPHFDGPKSCRNGYSAGNVMKSSRNKLSSRQLIKNGPQQQNHLDGLSFGQLGRHFGCILLKIGHSRDINLDGGGPILKIRTMRSDREPVTRVVDLPATRLR